MGNVSYKKMSLFDAPEGSVLSHACNGEGVWGSDKDGDLLVPVYENGHILRTYNFSEIRERASVKVE